MKNRKLRKVCPLAVEQFEPRLVPAGLVMMSVNGGTLKIQGDDNANNFQIDHVGGGAFTITGRDNETFLLNGVLFNSGDFVLGVTNDIKIDLKGGNDHLTFSGLGKTGADPQTARKLEIKTKQGADVIQVQNARFTDKVTIDAGQGDGDADDDFLQIENVSVAKALTVKTGKGSDRVQVQITDVVGKSTFQTKEGVDIINILGGTFVNKLDINAGKAFGGFDSVIVQAKANILGELKITTADGNDDLIFDDFTAGKVTIKTGAGDDEIVVARSSLNPVTVNELQVDLGKGNDTAVIGFAGTDAKLVLNGPKISKIKGGADFDTINGAGNVTGLQFFADPFTTGFEAVNI